MPGLGADTLQLALVENGGILQHALRCCPSVSYFWIQTARGEDGVHLKRSWISSVGCGCRGLGDGEVYLPECTSWQGTLTLLWLTPVARTPAPRPEPLTLDLDCLLEEHSPSCLAISSLLVSANGDQAWDSEQAHEGIPLWEVDKAATGASLKMALVMHQLSLACNYATYSSCHWWGTSLGESSYPHTPPQQFSGSLVQMTPTGFSQKDGLGCLLSCLWMVGVGMSVSMPLPLPLPHGGSSMEQML